MHKKSDKKPGGAGELGIQSEFHKSVNEPKIRGLQSLTSCRPFKVCPVQGGATGTSQLFSKEQGQTARLFMESLEIRSSQVLAESTQVTT